MGHGRLGPIGLILEQDLFHVGLGSHSTVRSRETIVRGKINDQA